VFSNYAKSSHGIWLGYKPPRIIPTLKARTLAEILRNLMETKADTKYEALFLLVLAIWWGGPFYNLPSKPLLSREPDDPKTTFGDLATGSYAP
jgi:hypothetical protein